MTRKIVVKLDKKSIGDAIKELNDYKKSLPYKCSKVAERVANEILIPVMKINLSTAQYDGATPEIEFRTEEQGSGKVAVIASGEALCFIEFGTGVTYPDIHPKSAELGMVRGGYGDGHGKQSSWGYYGEPGSNGRVIKKTDQGDLVITHGNPANMPIYNSVVTASMSESLIAQIAREVFAND